MPLGWKLGDASVPFLDTDFFLKREPESWIYVTTLSLDYFERRMPLDDLLQNYAPLATAIATYVSNLPAFPHPKWRTSGPTLPYGAAPLDTAERLVRQEDPRVIVYAAMKRGGINEAALIVASAKNGDLPLEDARSLASRIEYDARRSGE